MAEYVPEYDLAEGVEVTVFGRPLCGDCDEAKKAIEKAQVSYTYRNVLGDQKAQKQFTDVCNAVGMEPAVPVITIRHKTPTVNSEMVFIEPRELDLKALTGALLALRMPAPRK